VSSAAATAVEAEHQKCLAVTRAQLWHEA